jgi:hypothetical protein
MSNKISIVNTGKKYSFKDKDELKAKIYEMALDNVDEAKSLYTRLVPANADQNTLTVNSESAVNCLKIIREQTESLVKLFGEINRAEKDLGDSNKQIGPGVIYDVLAELEAKEKKALEDAQTTKELEARIETAKPEVSAVKEEKEKEDLDKLYEDNQS